MTERGKKIVKAATVLVTVAVLAVAVWIMLTGRGLSPDRDFGAGAYYYADIPDFEKYLGGRSNPTAIPYIIYVLLFLAWGALMYFLWKWIDKR